jgi:ADP-ribose pyrophosphatase YjhB (NUDIX family)
MRKDPGRGAGGPKALISEEQYQLIRRTMPIPCVDLVVENPAGEVLLLRRANEPAKGQWWMPGGRVNFGETREGAAARKLQEECSLDALNVRELATRDLFLEFPELGELSHAITTVFRVDVARVGTVILDSQSTASAWRRREDWFREDLHPFVLQSLRLA